MEFARLGECVAAGRGVHDEQCFVGRFLVLFRQAAFHFRQLRHQIAFRVEPAGGVAKKELDVLPIGRFVGFVAKRSRVGVVLSADHFHAEPFRPNSELLDRRGAKSVRRRQHHAVAIAFEIMRQLRGRRCLAGSIHADDQQRFRPRRVRRDRQRRHRQNPPDLVARDFRDVVRCNRRSLRAILERFDNPQRHRHAEIGADQHRFQFVPIDRATGELLDERFEEIHSAGSDLGGAASRNGRLRSSFTRSRMPLTKRPESGPPKVFASSMASLMETTGGMSSR